ncbi:DUF4312 family protein [Vagococcus xieshaowenii]|uniref:DUF4312 family protein n=1 Tax=Vagococcus xieshaowenii TaxID=2562451 RepID=A0AAJ5EE96_9ENTE|nr:DUF4312 family protein [Vagococcus xieshaowenii]QCA29397.1 DUF4312 family protein [Vagococcus xieshaowenii]TFZ39310.1 DUF4312 family protein [Vagococcus xieshaowenii]
MGLAKVEVRKVMVEGKGENKTAAFASALSSIQTKLIKGSDDVILKLSPIDIEVISAKHEVSKEKFMFFFFPREKHHYEVSLRVTVEQTYVPIADVAFDDYQESNYIKNMVG